MKTRDFSGIGDNGPLPAPQDVAVPEEAGYLVDEYIESTVSLLVDLERATLGYETRRDRQEIAAAIKRILHKLKGEAGVVGADDIHELCHQAETAFEEIFENKRPDMLLRVKDWIYSAVHNIRR